MYHNDPVFAQDGVKHLRHEIAPLVNSRARYRTKYSFDIEFLFERIKQLETMYCSKDEYMAFFNELKSDIMRFKRDHNISAPRDDGEYHFLLEKVRQLLCIMKNHPRAMEWEKRLQQFYKVNLHTEHMHQILETQGENLYKLYVEIDDAIPL